MIKYLSKDVHKYRESPMDNKDNGRIEDLSKALTEVGFTALFESETFHQVLVEAADVIFSGTAAPLLGAILGAAAPRVNGVFLSYKQYRFERNVSTMIDVLSKRVDTLESNYSKLNSKVKELYQTKGVEMLLDSIVDEPQEEKTRYCTDAFVALMTNDANENIMAYFFKTLRELTVLDIDILWIYSHLSDANWDDIQQKHGIDWDYIQMVREKLVRFGLLFRKNDQLRDKNNDEIVEYLLKVESDSRKSKPQGVKLPRTLKKIGHSESYGITKLGMSLLKCIGRDEEAQSN